ncbi:MAG: universal stress protein [Chloroflexi bacterium]|nr:universal stress protein [Chloroflexota bacterium]
MLDEILVLLDGSALAQGALPAARALAQAFTANITLLRVLETDDKEMSTQVDPVSWHLRKAEAQAYLNNLRQTWPTSKKRPRVVLQEERPLIASFSTLKPRNRILSS